MLHNAAERFFPDADLTGRVGILRAGEGVSPERTLIPNRDRDARCIARRAGCPPYPGRDCLNRGEGELKVVDQVAHIFDPD